MKAKKITRKTIRVELEEWEARDLRSILSRIKGKEAIRKSEFSLREKTTGRRLLEHLEEVGS